jgi:hypothetical protein
MKFTLKHHYIFNPPHGMMWHLFPTAHTINVRDYLAIRTYCMNMWGEPGVVWQVRGSIWYFCDEADALQVLITFS